MNIDRIVKKTLTLFILSVFLLNVLGFYGVFLGLKFHNTSGQVQALNENRYAQQEEITFKLPLTVPYYTSTDDEYKRVDGEFEHDGEVYRMVKQKLSKDTLFVVCIKDRDSKELNEAMADYVETYTDKASSSKNQNTKSLTSFSKDYFSSVIGIEAIGSGWNESISYSEHQDHYSHIAAITIYSPPRTVLG